jgi:MGT family glycosyltransferase
MARVLITVLPATGHVNPLVAIAQALVQEGHAVVVATDDSCRMQLERTHTPFFALPYPPNAVAHALKAFAAPARWTTQLQIKPPQAYFFDHLALLTDSVIDLIHRYEPDAVLTDLNFYAGPIAAEACGIPYASFCGIVNTLITPDAPPYGLGSDWRPPGDWRRRLWPLLCTGMNTVLWRHDRTINTVRRSYGLPPVKGGLLAHSPYLALVPTTDAYEYPREEVPPQMMYVGPVTAAERGEIYDDFPWQWFEDERPTVYVSMGTIVGGMKVFKEVVKIARDAPWKAILAIGRNSNMKLLEDAPDNVLVRNYVSQHAILKRVQAVVSHGGNNTVTEALLHGLPLAVIPISADQPESAARVKASGAGIRLRPRLARGEHLRNAIDAILNDPAYRYEARRIQTSYARCDGSLTSARLIAKLADSKKPVYRPAGQGPTVLPDDVHRF